jgi:predicted ArsR family transcriptional regulator
MFTDPTIKTRYRVLAAFRENQAAGLPVTLHAIAKKVGLAAISNARAHLIALERDGLIEYQNRREKRAA